MRGTLLGGGWGLLRAYGKGRERDERAGEDQSNGANAAHVLSNDPVGCCACAGRQEQAAWARAGALPNIRIGTPERSRLRHALAAAPGTKRGSAVFPTGWRGYA